MSSILYLPHHTSSTRKPMSRENRAGQFSSFACLTGHDEQIKETARLTENFTELTEDKNFELSWKIQIIDENIYDTPEVTFTCFVKDLKKSGGSYRTITGNVRRIDYFSRKFILTSGEEIDMDLVVDIDEHI